MPVIEIKMWSGRTREQKKLLVEEITDSFLRIAKTTPDHVHIVFYDVDKEDWGIAGKLSDE